MRSDYIDILSHQVMKVLGCSVKVFKTLYGFSMRKEYVLYGVIMTCCPPHMSNFLLMLSPHPLVAHADSVMSIACSPDGQHIVSGSFDTTIHVWELFAHPHIQQSSTCNQVHANFCVQPDENGWVRDSNSGLLYCVPTDCLTGLHSAALLTIPPTSHTQSVSLDFEDFVFGTSWTQIFNSANP